MALTPRVDTIRVDWDQDGTFGNPYAAVNADARVKPAIRIQRGRDQARSYSPPMIGRYSVVLDNQEVPATKFVPKWFKYTREDGVGQLYGHHDPGKWLYHVVDYAPDFLSFFNPLPLFRGLIDDIQLAPSMRNRSATLPALGVLSFLQNKKITTHLYQNITVAEAIAVVLEKCGNPGHKTANRWGAAGAAYCEWGPSGGGLPDGEWGEGWLATFKSLDTSDVVLSYWWLDEADAFQAVTDLLATEGAGANLFESAEGILTFKNRTHRWRDYVSVNSIYYLDDGSNDLTYVRAHCSYSDLGYTSGLRDIINDASFSAVTRMQGQRSQVDTVWRYGPKLALGFRGAVDITATFFVPPVVELEAIVAGTDYTIEEGSATVLVTDVTTTSAKVTVVAGVEGCVLSGLQLRGKPIVFESKIWEVGSSFSLDANTTVTLTVTTGQPCTAMLQPIEGLDYTVDAIGPSSGVTMTLAVLGAQRAQLTISAQYACTIKGLKVRGWPVTVASSTLYRTAASTATTASIAKYGQRTRTIQGRQDIAPADAQVLVDRLAAYYREPRPIYTLVLETGVGEYVADDLYYRMAIGLQVLIGQRLKIFDYVANTAGAAWKDVFVEQIEHTIESGGDRHVIKLACESAEGVTSIGEWGAAPDDLFCEWDDGTVWG